MPLSIFPDSKNPAVKAGFFIPDKPTERFTLGVLKAIFRVINRCQPNNRNTSL
jgi:hypothetical protein